MTVPRCNVGLLTSRPLLCPCAQRALKLWQRPWEMRPQGIHLPPNSHTQSLPRLPQGHTDETTDGGRAPGYTPSDAKILTLLGAHAHTHQASHAPGIWPLSGLAASLPFLPVPSPSSPSTSHMFVAIFLKPPAHLEEGVTLSGPVPTRSPNFCSQPRSQCPRPSGGSEKAVG